MGEQPEEALRREIREELGCEIEVQQHLGQSEVQVGRGLIVWMHTWLIVIR